MSNAGSDLAIGSGAKANQGAAELRNAKVSGSISNNVGGGSNLAVERSKAHMRATVVKSGHLGSASTRVGGGALNLALGIGAKTNSGVVVVNSWSLGGAHVYSGSGINVNDMDSPLSYGTNVNNATSGHESDKNSVVVK